MSQMKFIFFVLFSLFLASLADQVRERELDYNEAYSDKLPTYGPSVITIISRSPMNVSIAGQECLGTTYCKRESGYDCNISYDWNFLVISASDGNDIFVILEEHIGCDEPLSFMFIVVWLELVLIIILLITNALTCIIIFFGITTAQHNRNNAATI